LLSSQIRLQKFLSEAGVTSRRDGERLIRDGRVSVNGTVVTVLGTKVTPESDRVAVDGRIVSRETKRLFIFHKPTGVVTTLRDPHAKKTIASYTRTLDVRVFPVGRLDADVCGLLLLTNDGDFAEQQLHPRFGVKRVYWAFIEGPASARLFATLRKGVDLRDGIARAIAARTRRYDRQVRHVLGELPLGASVVEIVVDEGRNHFVKRLLARAGHRVLRLARVRFGPYDLGDLPVGEIREIGLPDHVLGIKRRAPQSARTRRSGAS
jgi:pseudouridine synthase